MKHSEFKVGEHFLCGNKAWRCTDKGSRVVIAIHVDGNPSWLNGPPYAVAEVVFDEDDMLGCSK